MARRTRPDKPIPIWLLPEEIAALDAHATSLGISRHALMRAAAIRSVSTLTDVALLTPEERARSRRPSS